MPQADFFFFNVRSCHFSAQNHPGSWPPPSPSLTVKAKSLRVACRALMRFAPTHTLVAFLLTLFLWFTLLDKRTGLVGGPWTCCHGSLRAFFPCCFSCLPCFPPPPIPLCLAPTPLQVLLRSYPNPSAPLSTPLFPALSFSSWYL